MGTTIGKVLISYDIDKFHTQVKTALEKIGYADSWKNTNAPKIYYLPNTTLWHTQKTTDQAMLDLKGACSGAGAKLEKAIAVNASEFVGV